MSDLKLSLREIEELMNQLKSTDLGSLYVKDGDFELRLDAKQAAYPMAYAAAPEAAPLPAAVSESAPAPAEEPAPGGKVVKSPIVGTFYAASAPDKAPYVEVGSRVKKGDVLFVIESMKLMNEIQSDYDGEVAEILVSNAQGVEFGQPIMVIR